MSESTGAQTELELEMVSFRKERKLSQADIARLMGTTQSAVSELEKGRFDPRLSTLRRYAHALGVHLTVQLEAVTTYTDRTVHYPTDPLQFSRGSRILLSLGDKVERPSFTINAYFVDFQRRDDLPLLASLTKIYRKAEIYSCATRREL